MTIPYTGTYLTSDEFFDILKLNFDQTYGNSSGIYGGLWNPEDLYINVQVVLEVTSNTLAGLLALRNERPLYGIKE